VCVACGTEKGFHIEGGEAVRTCFVNFSKGTSEGEKICVVF